MTKPGPPSGSSFLYGDTAVSSSDYNLLEYVEIDATRCQLSYGTSPCTASVGVTGSTKCYNSPATCQDPSNYSAGTKTFRFASPTADLPVSIDARPNIKSISVRAQEVHPGESLGTRESVTVTFENHRDSDAGYDPYISDRSFNPYNRGTHWGKFIARWPNLQGYPLRVIRGALGQSIDEMETRHYYIESSTGPDINGRFSLTAKDALKFLDGKKAQAPVPSNGRLLNAITDTSGSLTLTPSGIGDEEYPSSGLASIGDEVVEFTRSGDSVTLTSRGARGTQADEHDEDETFQLALVYTSQDPATIIDSLIFDYTDTPSEYRDAALWLSETEAYYGRLLSAEIAKPTPVRDLVSELIEQVGLVMYTDLVAQKIRLRVLRHGITALAVNDDNHLASSLRFKQDEEKRVNAVYTYYALKNPLEDLDEHKNYSAIVALYDDDQVKALEDLPLSIRTIRSRWITILNRPAAEQINQSIIGRYGDTPGMCSFRLPFNRSVGLGDTITLQSRIFEDATGSEKSAQSAIITSINRREADYEVEAQLFNFRKTDSAPGSGVRTILIDASTTDLNLRTVHDSIYSEVNSGDTIEVIIASGVIVGASNYTNIAFDVGSWPAGVTITITNNGRIQGAGGGGGLYTKSIEFEVSRAGQSGGDAFYSRYAVSIDNSSGEIWGGGGGGGVTGSGSGPAYGGGGAGYAPGSGGGTATTEAGGSGSTVNGAVGHPGGDPGQAGTNGATENGGAAGNAVDGNSYVTWTSAGDIRGNQVN